MTTPTASLAPLTLAAAIFCACGASSPTLESVSVAPGAQANLTAVATYAASGAACARLRWTSDSDVPGQTACTAAATSGRMVALGLKPATSYSMVLELFDGKGGVTVSPPASVMSPDLPDDLKSVHIDVTGDATSGLTLTGIGLGDRSYVLAFDANGIIRWYQQLSGNAWVDAQQLKNGDFTVFSGASHGWDATPGEFLQFHATGEMVASYSVDTPEYLDPHELRVTTAADGATVLHYFTYVVEPWDLSAVGGSSNSPLAIHSIVRQKLGGEREVVWDAHGQVELSDRIEGPSPIAFPDLVHPNSLDFDLDGNYVVSFRDLGEIRKLDAGSGETLWRLGGVHSDFTFVNDPLGGFSAQHSARVLANGNILVYDNGWRHSPRQTRAVEYALDLANKTATMVWEYRPGPSLFTPFMGSVQRLSGGNTQVGFSQAGVVDEVDAGGRLVWEARLTRDGAPVAFYRALRIGALDRYVAP